MGLLAIGVQIKVLGKWRLTMHGPQAALAQPKSQHRAAQLPVFPLATTQIKNKNSPKEPKSPRNSLPCDRNQTKSQE
jgi:hypothetical protein